MPKCKMMMSFECVAQNKSTCPVSAACSSVQPSAVTWAISGQKFHCQVTNEQSQNPVLVN